ncbi:MAG: glycosyltransferase family 8 protein [Clostridia bacterium]|nr:glycosyltransferase family 8 protein [Clostridia bacterium]
MKCAVVYAANDRYSKVLGISLMSLFENNRAISDIDVYVLSNGICDENIKRINQLALMYNRVIHIVDINEELSKINKIETSWDISIYSRFFISDILPDNIEKVVYLDCDTLILQRLDELFNFNFEKEKTVYGVLDRYNVNSPDRLGLEDRIYINSGVLLIDLKAWRENNTADDLLSQCDKRNWKFPDQDIINYSLNGKIGILHPRYNVNKFTSVLPYEYAQKLSYQGIDKYYSQKMYEQAQQKPYIVHFSGSMFNRPWQKNSRQPYHEVWKEYFDKSPWKTLEYDKRIYTKKVSSTIYMWLTEKILWQYWKNKNYREFVDKYIMLQNFPVELKSFLKGKKHNE